MTYKQLFSFTDTEVVKKGYQDSIQSRLHLRYDALQNYLSKHGTSSLQAIVPKLNKICENIISTINFVYANQHTDAFRLLYDTYFSDNAKLYLQTYSLKKNTSLYKMRSADTYVQYTKETTNEMYHVPFELRYKVGNFRYNSTGMPTFYLSSSVYGCWEEVQRTNMDFANVSLFKPTRDLLFLDMTIPSMKKSIDTSGIMALPLIMASRLDVQRIGENFIPEYVIPQLAMECLIAARKHNENNNSAMIGIRYESIHNNKRDLLFDEVDKDDIFVNYAIPPFTNADKGICPQIKELFEFWKNTSWAEIKYKNVDVSAMNPKTHYEQSIFGIIESRLNLIPPGMLTYHTRNIYGIPQGALTI